MSIVLIRLIGVGVCLVAVAILAAAIVYGVRGDRVQYGRQRASAASRMPSPTSTVPVSRSNAT